MSALKRKKIVFVCTGNTCRSPMAEALLKDKLERLGLKGFAVCSAGIKVVKGDGINPKSAQVLTEHGLPTAEFSATKLTPKLVREAFAIVSMTEKQKEYLMDFRWNALRKIGEENIENNVYSFAEISGYEVIDPYGKDVDCYRYVYQLLDDGVDALIDKLDLRALAYVPKPRQAKKPKKVGETKGKRIEK